MAPGLIRDKVADRLATLNPSVRINPLSGKPLRDQIGRTMLRETQALYTQWQQQDTEGILRKSADTLEIILAGLKQHGLDQTDLLQARQERLNMFGGFDQGLYLQGPASESAPWHMDDTPSFLFTPDHADQLVYLIRSELERSDRACEGTPTQQEQALLDTPAEAFLTHLEAGLSPVKSYKMVVLTSLLDMPGTTWDIDDIATRFHRFFMDHPDKRFDYDDLAASAGPEHFPLAKVKAKLLQMPLHFLSNTDSDWFILDKASNAFSLKSELAPYWNDPFFRNLVADRVRFALTRYFSPERPRYPTLYIMMRSSRPASQSSVNSLSPSMPRTF